MKKVIRKGKVAVLYSPGWGAGWKSWGAPMEAVFHPRIVELVEKDKRHEITKTLMIELFGEEEGKFYLGGARDLEIEWIDKGVEFDISEYDGNESIEYKGRSDWMGA